MKKEDCVPDESGATRFLRDVEARRFHTSIEISHDSIAALVLTFQMMKILRLLKIKKIMEKFLFFVMRITQSIKLFFQLGDMGFGAHFLDISH